MIFQSFNLLMQRTALDNICFPGAHRHQTADAVKRARELLELVGLGNRADAYPAQLSGGQKQRWPSPGPWPPTPRSRCATRPPPP
ncbi:MAG: hypothetical protein ACLS43_03720 [Evtepia gabavorous]